MCMSAVHERRAYCRAPRETRGRRSPDGRAANDQQLNSQQACQHATTDDSTHDRNPETGTPGSVYSYTSGHVVHTYWLLYTEVGQYSCRTSVATSQYAVWIQ